MNVTTLHIGLQGRLFGLLGGRSALTQPHRIALSEAIRKHRTVKRGTTIIKEGDRPTDISFILSGSAIGYRQSEQGRQIISFLTCGDLIDPSYLVVSRCDQSIESLSKLELADIAITNLKTLITERPAIGEAVLTDTVRRASITQQWLANLNGRNSRSRTAHLFCEMAIRIGKPFGVGGVTYELPLTQTQLAEVLGLTMVHLYRVMKSLTAVGLITRERNSISIPDIGALEAAGDFSARYLHLEITPRERRKKSRLDLD